MISRTLYKPWGGRKRRFRVRYQSGTLPTQYTYTGQYSHTADFGLMFYVARWYDPYLNRFIQPDTIVPDQNNPMAWDRYTYSYNNPVKYTDPTGHSPKGEDEPPPVTLDEENGLCINFWNVGCSGTFESNWEWMAWNISMLPYELTNPQQWNDASVFLTDSALAASIAGASIETVATAAGTYAAGPFGTIVGAIGGNAIHQAVTNPIETVFSWGATLTTIGADIFSGNNALSVQNGEVSVSVGEASVTSAALQAVGSVIPIGVVDAAIDAHSSGYSHGQDGAPGAYSWFGMNLNGQTFSVGPFSITFGK